MSVEYTGILLRIHPYDESGGSYPVEAELDDGSRFAGGSLRLDRQKLLTLELDPEGYGLALFDSLFAGAMGRAYDQVTAIARTNTEGRLRVQLWIDDDAVELHALPWERLYHRPADRPIPLTTSALTPFSRYTSLQIREPPPVRQRPVRILIAVSNPADLPAGLSPVNVEAEVETLRQALGDLNQTKQIQATLLPGRTGLSPELRTRLEADGWQISDGPATLDNLLRRLPGVHVLQFVGHGHFRRTRERGAGQAALYMERDDGNWQAVTDEEFVTRLAAMGHLPHLIFLVACETAKREEQAEHPFVGLGPQLVQIGVPAVVAMQARVPMELAQQLAGEFYRQLLQHGEVDQALNQARGLVFEPDRTDWAIPVLFMRLREGLLFSSPIVPAADEPPSLPELSLERIPPTVPHFVDRVADMAAYREKLQRDRFVIITGMAGVGKTTLGAKLAREAAAREGDIFWFTFDPVEKNTADALFWALAAFLKSRRQPNLWRYLEGELDSHKPLDLTIKLNLLRAGLSSGDYVLCFDDFHVVRHVSEIAHVFRIIQERFLSQLQSRLILIGREITPDMDELVSTFLEGFTEEEARTFIAARNLQLSSALLKRLWERTEGNAKLLELSVFALSAIARNQMAVESFIQAMAARTGDIRDYVMTEIYDTLQPEEREMVGALAIFPAAVEREAVETILASEEITGVASRIDTLVNKHIVSEGEDGHLHCHSLVREYAYHVLDRKDRENFHKQAAVYFEEKANYLAAAHHYFERGDHAQALVMLTTHIQEIINLGRAGTLLDLLGRFQRESLSPQQWVDLCQAKGDCHKVRGEYQQAVEAYLAAMEEITSDDVRSILLSKIGITYEDLGEYKLALEYFVTSLGISKTLGDLDGMGEAHHNIGWAYYRLDGLEEARKHFALSQNIGQELGHKLLLAKTGLGLGTLDWREGKLEEARVRFEESRHTFRAFGERMREAMAIGNLGLIYHEMADTDRELSYYRQAMEIHEEIGDVSGLLTALSNLGYLYFQLGNHKQAIHYYDRLAQLAQDIGHKRSFSMAYSGLADVHLALKNTQQALELAQKAERVARDIGPGRELGISCNVLGHVWLALGDAVRARAYFEQSIPLLEAAKEVEDLVRARGGLENARYRLRGDSS